MLACNGELTVGSAVVALANTGLAGSYSCEPVRVGILSHGIVGSYSLSLQLGKGGLEGMSTGSDMSSTKGGLRSAPGEASSVDGRVK